RISGEAAGKRRYNRVHPQEDRTGGHMATPRFLVLTIAVLLVGGISVRGHHSFAAYYLEDQTVTIQGDLVVFEYRNPHAWLHVGALDNFGRLQKVSAEWANPGRLNQQGITKDTLKPGDR